MTITEEIQNNVATLNLEGSLRIPSESCSRILSKTLPLRTSNT